MIVVVQCAARKKADAGHLRRQDGQPVLFVADLASAPPSNRLSYACPDDVSDIGEAWRQCLLAYNATPGNNPLGLLPAWQLYENSAYGKLLARYGIAHLFILSAGWGLLAAEFLTPAYDITFSATAEKYKRRRRADRYNDFRMLPMDTTEPVVFLGGKDYIGLFCRLTDGLKTERHVFYNSATPPDAPGCILRRFDTATRTNWHYECAAALVGGRLALLSPAIMQNRYTGDIGDYVKYGLLRALSRGRRLGVAWYLYPDETHNADGRHIGYLNDRTRWRHCDPELFDMLERIVANGDRRVSAVEGSGIFNGANYYSEVLSLPGRTAAERRAWRSAWFARLLTTLSDREVVFADPDNGLCDDERFRPGQTKHWKRLPLTEAKALAQGRTAIIYHHNTRRPGGHVEEIKSWIENSVLGHWRFAGEPTAGAHSSSSILHRTLTQSWPRSSESGAGERSYTDDQKKCQMPRLTRSFRSRRIAQETYPFACCVVCGLTELSALDVAHLDQDPANDEPGNLAYLCRTHHVMYDCGLYPIDGIKLLRAHWQHWHANGARADHSIYMKDAGLKAALTRRRKAAATKAAAARRVK